MYYIHLYNMESMYIRDTFLGYVDYMFTTDVYMVLVVNAER